MAVQLRLRSGTATEHNTFTGAVGEVTVDTTNKTLRVHDGNVVGGITLANRQDIDENLLNYLPTPYPKDTPPVGYLALMGQTISQATYPKLFALYGAVLPDLRAYTIRGLDKGRGVDVGRAILSEQDDAIRNIIGAFNSSNFRPMEHTSGAFYLDNTNLLTGGWDSYVTSTSPAPTFDASRVVPTASENRVKNIAFLYIVKAG